jgi:hypothetical protein
MRTRLFLLGSAVAAIAVGPLYAPPPPKDTTTTPDETVTAEPATLTDIQNARARTKSSNNLKQIALALHNYHDANGNFPQDVCDSNGKPILSWRVLLLPYIEQDNIYKSFKMDETWNSRTNIELLEKMPDVFSSPRVTVKKKGYTVYQGFAGEGAVFESKQKLTFTSITDGTSNTLFAVEATAAVPWSKPADIPFDVKKDVPAFGKAFDSTPLGALCDGSVRVLNLNRIKPETLKAAITRNGGEVMGPDW